jgi:hypothetical protein
VRTRGLDVACLERPNRVFDPYGGDAAELTAGVGICTDGALRCAVDDCILRGIWPRALRCSFLQATHFPAEGSRVRDPCPAPQKSFMILPRVVAPDEETLGVAWTPAERPPFRCAFLVNGSRRIYDVRPFVCRGWNSADTEACRRALGQDSIEMRFDLFQRTIFAGIERGPCSRTDRTRRTSS